MQADRQGHFSLLATALYIVTNSSLVILDLALCTYYYYHVIQLTLVYPL